VERSELTLVAAVAAGSALGGVARFWLSGVVARAFGETFPWGTLAVNVLGSLVIGLVAALTGPDARLLVSPALRTLILIGVLGGFTTFSSFSLNTLNLTLEGEWLRAGANVLLSVALCLVAVWLGWTAGATLNR